MSSIDAYSSLDYGKYLSFAKGYATRDGFTFQKHVGSLAKNADIYVWKGVNYDITNDTERLEAKIQNYIASKDVTSDDIKDMLQTPYVNLRAENLRNGENKVVLTPGTTLYYDSGYNDNKGKDIIWQIDVTNCGVEVKYNGWRVAQSDYSAKIYAEDVNNDYSEWCIDQLNATENIREQWGGEYSFIFMGRAGAIAEHLDKLIRVANGQLDIDVVDYSDELCFADVMQKCGIDMDFSKEFYINGQGFRLNKSQMYGSYAMMEYTTPPRDCSALEFLSVCHANIAGKTESSDVCQIAVEEWKKYVEKYQKECVENYLVGNKQIDWIEFFDKMLQTYKEQNNIRGINNCSKVLEMLRSRTRNI